MRQYKGEVLQIVDSSKAGGIETHILQVSRGLKNTGWLVRVVFIENYGPHPLKDSLKELGIDYHVLDGRISTFLRFIGQNRSAILHSHGYKAGIISRILGKILRLKVVSTFHAGEQVSGKLALYSLIDHLTAPLSQPIAVSRLIAAKLPAKTQVMNNFVSVPNISNQTDRQIIAFVG
ncbi:MAG: glycosyltransferase, partial [Alphaproteobacteria bacterium]|nr:glycosyltransferase [Alphaproteobacteria bacterium]